MAPLVRLERFPDPDRAPLLGHDWIEVLWVEPWVLVDPRREEPPDTGWFKGMERKVRSTYVCLTPDGLVRIGDDDFWAAVEERNEYVVVPKYGPANKPRD